MNIILFFIRPEKKDIFKIDSRDDIHINLEESGTYYIKIVKEWEPKNKNNDNSFYIFIPRILIDTIDFTCKKYYNNKDISFYHKENFTMYKVNNLKNDIYVYFDYNISDIYSEDEGNFPNPFEICDKNNECEKNVTIYKFEKGKDYTIYINCVNDKKYYNEFYYPSYFFFPIYEDTIKQNELGEFSLLEPKIFIFDLKNAVDLNFLLLNGQKMYISFSENKISLDNLDKLIYENYTDVDEYIKLNNSSGKKYAVIIPIPLIKDQNFP